MSEPKPTTQLSPPFRSRKPTERSSPAMSPHRSRTACSPPGRTVTMMKMAAPVSGPLTGCGIVTAWLAGVWVGGS